MNTAHLDESRLQNVRRTGGKTLAQCPACAEEGHDKEGNHLAIMPDGKFGCIAYPGAEGDEHRKRIFALAGVKGDERRLPPVKHTPPAPRKLHKDADAAAKATEWSVNQGQPVPFREVARHDYRNQREDVYAQMLRFEPYGPAAGKKTFRPIHAAGEQWQTGDPTTWLPYHADKIAQADLKEPVFVHEGEGCADAGLSIGLLSTTSAHGAKSPEKTDWTILAGRNVNIIPDADEAGDSYAATVAAIVTKLNPPASVKIVELPGLGEGEDIVEYLEQHDAQAPEDIKAAILRLADKVPEYQKATEISTTRINTTGDPIEAAIGGTPLARTDTGLAERFVFYHKAEVVYQLESGAWFVWNGRRWRRDPGLVEIRRRMAETARKIKDEVTQLPETLHAQTRMEFFRFALSCEQIGRMDAAIRLAPSLGLARSLELFDADPLMLSVSNGTLDLRTGNITPHRMEDFITKASAVEFRPGAENDPLFRKFIEHATSGDRELETYLQRAAGYTLTGDISEKCLFIVYSELTDTSKTCFITGLLTILGEYGMTINFDAILEPDRGGQTNYDVAKLCGTRLAVASETKPGRRFAAELIKQLTGGDTLRAREIRQSSVEFRPTHKLWLSTNHAPMLADGGDEATWNRLRRVPFNNQVPKAERDPRFLAALADPTHTMAQAFLAWAVQGAVAWRNHGLKTCLAVDDSTAAYQQETDPLSDFLEDACEIDPSGSTTAAELRAAYEAWAATNGQRFTLSRQRFAAVLRKHGCHEHRGAGGVRSWIGISLKGE